MMATGADTLGSERVDPDVIHRPSRAESTPTPVRSAASRRLLGKVGVEGVEAVLLERCPSTPTRCRTTSVS